MTPSAAARAAAARLASAPDAVLSEADSAAILRQLGVPLVESREATTLAQAAAAADAVGYPLVLKAMVPGVAHKNAAGLVITSISNKAELERAHAVLTERTRGKADVRVLLQPMLPAKFELIVGVSREAQLGHFLVFGLGGVNAELFDQVLLLPIELDIAAMTARIAGSRLGALLRTAGTRLRVRSPAADPRRAAATHPRRARPDRVRRSQSRHRHQGQRSHGRRRTDCSKEIAMITSVMAGPAEGRVPAIHAFSELQGPQRRGWPGQARP